MIAEEVIQRSLEGLLTPEQEEALQREVIVNPELRAAYVESAWLHAQLRAQRDLLLADLPATPVPEVRVDAGGVHFVWLTWRGVAAIAALVAILAVAATSIFFRARPVSRTGTPAPVATLVAADNCKWAGSDLPTAVNSPLGPGLLALCEGMATLRFSNGASVTMEAPTRLRIVDAMHCRLLEGSLVAEVPEPAHGFTIDTADLKVVDLGTKFGVASSATGNSQVRVFKGEVEIGGLPGIDRKRLTEGNGVRAGAGFVPPGQEPSRGQAVREEDGWTSVPTSFGRGKDGYARRGHATPEAAERQPLIMVKHSELPSSRNNERRALITFDLSQITPAKISEAQIVLEPQPSGYGFSSLVPDSRFAVYGITDEALDGWDEHALRWDDASLPGGTAELPDPQTSRKLAEFAIPRGGLAGPLIVRDPQLAAFIRQKTNGLVTFLLVRETGETDPNGLVHAFAGKGHPTARPPTLRLK